MFIRVGALEAALEKLKVIGVTATQLLHTVREEEDNLPPKPEQTGAALKRTGLHLYVSNHSHSDRII